MEDFYTVLSILKHCKEMESFINEISDLVGSDSVYLTVLQNADK